MTDQSWPSTLADATTLVDVLQWRAAVEEEHAAYFWLKDGRTTDRQMTYGDVDRQARELATMLRSRIQPGERALLVYGAGLDVVVAFWACLYAGIVAVPAPAIEAIRPKQCIPRLKAIIEDAAIEWILSSSEVLQQLVALFNDFVPGSPVRFLDTTAAERTHDHALPDLCPASDDVAYLQYTSGTTAAPRGVIVAHGTLLSHCRSLFSSIGWDRSSRSLCWLPYFHDYGLVHGILAPVYAGMPAYLMSPAVFLRRPLRWIEAISHYRISHSGAPNFAYEQCVRIAEGNDLQGLDLSCWSVASCGAEPILAKTVRAFIRTLAPVGFAPEAFMPAYGLAEHVLLVTAGRGLTIHEVDAEKLAEGWVVPAQEGRRRRTFVSCGAAISGTRVAIVDPETGVRCAPNQVGEIWVSGPSVAAGYWNKPAETQETFSGRLPGEPGLYLRTGDLGFQQDGQLIITGRRKDLIIIAGRNHAPQDIEEVVWSCHPSLRIGSAAAFAIAGDAGEQVVIVHEVERGTEAGDIETIATAIRLAVWEAHQLPVFAVVLVRPGGLCRTSSGKIQRQATRQAWIDRKLPIIAESVRADLPSESCSEAREAPTELEQTLMQIWKEVLAVNTVRRFDNLFDLGAHSLHVTQIASRIETRCGVHLPLHVLFETPTITGLAKVIETIKPYAMQKTEPLAIVPVPRDRPLPLSFSQERMWFMYQLVPDGTAYNIPIALRLSGWLNRDGFRYALQELIRRHDSLRTTVIPTAEGAMQVIHQPSSATWIDIDVRSLPNPEREALRLVEEDARRPFDLTKGPLFRVMLIQLDANVHILYVNMHHIVGDQWSYGVLGREWATLYNEYVRDGASAGGPRAIQYADFAVWQRRFVTDAALQVHLDYWRRKLAGLSPLTLPTDYVRPQVQRYIGSFRAVPLSDLLLATLTRLCAEEGATLFMGLLAAFQILLSRYSGQQDIAVGVPIANRTCVVSEDLVGTFVNTLVIRTDLSGSPSFKEVLQRVRATAIEAYDHQDMPFERLVDKLAPQRDLSHSPLIQVLFNMVNAPLNGIQFDGLSWVPVEFDGGASQFDLTMTIDPVLSKTVSLAFRTDLFSGATIERMLNHYLTLLDGIAADPCRRCSEYPILSPVEQRRMLVEWNRTEASYPKDMPLPALIAAQAARTPDAIAVSSGDDQLLYGEMDRESTQMARYLVGLGVQPGDIVGISLERTPLEVVGLLAIMKAGAAYLPLDFAYPKERLQYVNQETGCRLILTSTHVADRLLPGNQRLVFVDQIKEQVRRESSEPLPGPAPTDLAYVLYTSGSTGRPKGVAIRHRSLVNFLWSMRRLPGCTAEDRLLSVTTLAFDIAGLERYLPLIVGGQVELVSRAVATDGRLLRQRMEAWAPTIMQATPATWRMLIEAGWSGSPDLVALCGGEALSRELADQILPRVRALWNLYGPTETTIWSTVSQVTADKPEITIGRPIANTRLYVLDPAGLPVPVGVPGELYIGGDGLAAGYYNQPELTAERFIPDPFDSHNTSRLYKTGDLVRYRADGELVHLGRLDHQVKIRGFRVELGEIEAVLSEQAGVRQAIVCAKPDASGNKQLIAYVSAGDQNHPSSVELKAAIRRRLPDYMVPAHVIFVKEFPLLPNGKIDLMALPAPEEPSRSSTIGTAQPRTAVEIQLAALWQQVLGISNVDIHQNFFEVGGHSLKAVQLFSLLEEVFKKRLPLATLFQAPTIAQLADILATSHWSPPWRSLVAIQPRGNAVPCFAVPGIGGGVLGFARLAQLLGSNQPFYGLQPRGLNGDEAPFRSLKNMAAHYVQEIRTVRPTGPYVLMGICTGGVVAYEMAQQLAARDEHVVLIILESWHPLSYNGHFIRLKRLARPVLYVWGRLAQFLDRSRHLSIRPRLQLALSKVAGVVDRLRVHADDMMLGETYNNLRVAEATLEAIAFYKPEEYRGRLLNVTASQRVVPDSVLDTRKLWEFLARGGATAAAVPAINSGQFLAEPHVDAVANLVRSYIERELSLQDEMTSARSSVAPHSTTV
jgi:amino acid adenylation domain-containing protein